MTVNKTKINIDYKIYISQKSKSSQLETEALNQGHLNAMPSYDYRCTTRHFRSNGITSYPPPLWCPYYTILLQPSCPFIPFTGLYQLEKAIWEA